MRDRGDELGGLTRRQNAVLASPCQEDRTANVREPLGLIAPDSPLERLKGSAFGLAGARLRALAALASSPAPTRARTSGLTERVLPGTDVDS